MSHPVNRWMTGMAVKSEADYLDGIEWLIDADIGLYAAGTFDLNPHGYCLTNHAEIAKKHAELAELIRTSQVRRRMPPNFRVIEGGKVATS